MALRRSLRAVSRVCRASRLSEAISDGVSGLGAREVAGFGLGEPLKAVTESAVPPIFQFFAMLYS